MYCHTPDYHCPLLSLSRYKGTDEESEKDKQKRIPEWARGQLLKEALEKQYGLNGHTAFDPDSIFTGHSLTPFSYPTLILFTLDPSWLPILASLLHLVMFYLTLIHSCSLNICPTIHRFFVVILSSTEVQTCSLEEIFGCREGRSGAYSKRTRYQHNPAIYYMYVWVPTHLC